jgi:hypothetical protein
MTSPRPKHDASLDDLAQWVIENNNDMFDTGDFPATEGLDDEEAQAARDEYEAMADMIENNLQLPS